MRQPLKDIRHILRFALLVMATVAFCWATPLSASPSSDGPWHRYLDIGTDYYFGGQTDSAKVYLEQVFENDTEGKIEAAKYLLDIALVECDTSGINNYALFLSENYDQSLSQARHQVHRRYLLIGAMVLLLLVVLVWVLLRLRKAYHRQREAFDQQRQDFDQQRQDFDQQRHTYSQQLTAAQTAIEKQTFENLQKQTREILSKGSQRKRILEAFNSVYPHAYERLKATYPDLNDQEYDLLVLNFLEFRIKEEAEILELSQNTVMKYRSNLLKKVGKDPISGLLTLE